MPGSRIASTDAVNQFLFPALEFFLYSSFSFLSQLTGEICKRWEYPGQHPAQSSPHQPPPSGILHNSLPEQDIFAQLEPCECTVQYYWLLPLYFIKKLLPLLSWYVGHQKILLKMTFSILQTPRARPNWGLTFLLKNNPHLNLHRRNAIW